MSEPSRFPPPSEKQGRILWLSVTALSVGVLLGLLGLLLWGVGFVLDILAPVLWPLAISGVLAYLLDPLVDYIEAKKIKRFWAIIITYFICVFVFLCLLASIVPRLVVEGQAMVQDFPRYKDVAVEKVTAWIESSPLNPAASKEGAGATNAAPDYLTLTNAVVSTGAVASATVTNVDVAVTTNGVLLTNDAVAVSQTAPSDGGIKLDFLDAEFGEKLFEWLGRVAPQIGVVVKGLLSKLATWGGMAIGLALVPVFCFYFLLEEENIRAGWTRYLPVQDSWFKDELVFVISSINDYLIVFFRGQVLVALCDGILFSIGFLAVGLPYAVLIGLVAGALSIVPYLGAILTIVPAVLLAIVAFHDWLHPILIVLVFSAVQALEGFVISPKIMGDRVGLHPFTIILAVLIGSLLMGGILGGILAIPLTAAARVLMFRYVWNKPDTAAGPR